MRDARQQTHLHHYLIATLSPVLLVLTLLVFLFSRFYDESRFYAQQQSGVGYIERQLVLIDAMQRSRGLTQLGEPLPAELQLESIALMADELAADPLSEQYGTRKLLTVIRNRLRLISPAEASADNRLDHFHSMTQLIAQVRDVLVQASNRSSLILDQELDIYYLADLLTNSLPAMAEALARIRGLGSGLLVSDTWGAEDDNLRTQFAEYLGQARQPLHELQWVGNLFASRETSRFSSEIPEHMLILKSGLDEWTRGIQRDLSARAPSGDAEAFYRRGSELIGETQVLSRLVAEDLKRTMVLRSQRLSALRLGLSLFALIALALSVYSVRRFYLNNRRTIEQLHSARRMYQVLSEVNALVLRKPEREELLRRVAEIVVEDGGLRMAWIGQFKPDQGVVVPLCAAGHEDGYMDELNITLDDHDKRRGPVATSILAGESVTCNDIENDTRMRPWRPAALKRGYRSLGAFPFVDGRGGEGSLNVYAEGRHYFNDELVGLFESLAADISHALDVLENERQLSQVARQLSLHLQQTPLGVITWDQAFNIVDWNPAAEQLFGYTRAQAQGRNWKLLFPESVHEEFERSMLPILGAGEAEYLLLQNTTAEGRTLDCEWYTTRITDDQGEVMGVVSLLHDVSESREAQEQVLELNRELEQRVGARTAELQLANRELEAFSYSVSHDLRAPLRSLDGFSHLLLKNYAEVVDETGRDYLERIRRASQKMGTIIDDLISLSRVSRSELQRQRVDVSAMARQVFVELAEAEPQRAVEWRVASGLYCDADPRMLKLALSNLIGNAWKYTAHSERQEIDFGPCDIEGRSGFYLRDSGAGFDMRFVDKLFSAFQRLHGDEEFEGSGIGLATVKRIIDRHGGSIRAEGAVGEGAIFYFTCG